jgi:hypothetical protein
MDSVRSSFFDDFEVLVSFIRMARRVGEAADTKEISSFITSNSHTFIDNKGEMYC